MRPSWVTVVSAPRRITALTIAACQQETLPAEVDKVRRLESARCSVDLELGTRTFRPKRPLCFHGDNYSTSLLDSQYPNYRHRFALFMAYSSILNETRYRWPHRSGLILTGGVSISTSPACFWGPWHRCLKNWGVMWLLMISKYTAAIYNTSQALSGISWSIGRRTFKSLSRKKSRVFFLLRTITDAINMKLERSHGLTVNSTFSSVGEISTRLPSAWERWVCSFIYESQVVCFFVLHFFHLY